MRLFKAPLPETVAPAREHEIKIALFGAPVAREGRKDESNYTREILQRLGAESDPPKHGSLYNPYFAEKRYSIDNQVVILKFWLRRPLENFNAKSDRVGIEPDIIMFCVDNSTEDAKNWYHDAEKLDFEDFENKEKVLVINEACASSAPELAQKLHCGASHAISTKNGASVKDLFQTMAERLISAKQLAASKAALTLYLKTEIGRIGKKMLPNSQHAGITTIRQLSDLVTQFKQSPGNAVNPRDEKKFTDLLNFYDNLSNYDNIDKLNGAINEIREIVSVPADKIMSWREPKSLTHLNDIFDKSTNRLKPSPQPQEVTQYSSITNAP